MSAYCQLGPDKRAMSWRGDMKFALPFGFAFAKS